MIEGITCMKNSLNRAISTLDIRNLLIFSKKYVWYFAFLLFFILCTFVLTAFVTMDNYCSYASTFIENSIEVYNNVNPQRVCEVIDCKTVYILPQIDNVCVLTSKLTYNSSRDLLAIEQSELTMKDLIHVKDNKYLNGTELLMYSEKLHALFSISFGNYTYLTEKAFFGFLFSMIALFIFLMYGTYKRERREALLQTIGSEAILSNKSMIMITENVHHELNTPIEIIDNKIEKIHRTITQYIIGENDWWVKNANLRAIPEEKRAMNKKMVKLEKDFEFIRVAFEQMFAVLNKMKNFKSLRYSNGDKTIFDIIDGSFRIISISNADFNYVTDPEFKNYRMVSPTFKNIDLLNVLINHFKNSLEANANKIEVNMDISKFETTQKISILIKDNGNGIQDNIKHKIFQPNLSSKAIGDTIRGNGMYLNKHILTEAGGDIKIKETSPNGTIIAVTLPVKYVEYIESYF